MNIRSKQKGMTFFGFAFTLGMAVFFGTLLFKVGPMYTEHATIKTAMKSLKTQPDLASMSREMVADMLRKRLEMNNVSFLTPQDIIVIKRGGYAKVQIAYDRTVHLFGNLDAVAHFDDAIEVGSE